MNGFNPVQSEIQFHPLATGDDPQSVAIELSPVGVHSPKRRQQWRDFNRRKLSSMSPEELKAFKQQKKEYDKSYREKKRAERKAYMSDPIRQERWRKMRNDHYRKFRARPRTLLTSDEKRNRAIQSGRRYREQNKHNAVKRLIWNTRTRMCHILRGKVAKVDTTIRLIGCTVEEFKAHLEKQFQPGMTWENYGKKGWEVDHVRPCTKWDLSDPEQQRQCFSYKNCQPLWMRDNVRKGNRLSETALPIP